VSNCPDPEVLAAFAEGRLAGAPWREVVAHLDGCEECTHEVALAMAARGEEASVTRFRRWPLALAAVLVLAILGVATMRDLLPVRRSPVGRLVAASPKSERVVEPRLTGGFAWAEYAGTERSSATGADAERMQLTGVAGQVIADADQDRGDVESQHAAGVALMLVQKSDEAIARLEAAAANARGNAKTWSDLAAAYYAAAAQSGRASLYPIALGAADEALRIDARLAEALFNRALILERMGLTGEARAAWTRYLAVDPSSPWAVEARAHLADLPAAPQSRFDRDRPLLEGAAERGDAAAVRRYVDLHRDRSRSFAEAEYLGRWAEAVQRDDAAVAARWLAIARGIGDALAASSGEALARDAVRRIDGASPSERNAIAAAHVAYRNARIAYSRDQLEAGERGLLAAADAFERARHPMALAARYYAASARLARSDYAGARSDLEHARAAVDAHPAYLSLGAHVRWELGRALMIDSDWTSAAQVLRESAALFQRAGERSSEAFVEGMLARALSSAGRYDDAWISRTRAFAALSADGQTELLATSVAGAMRGELLDGRTGAALALSALQLSIARSGSRPALVMDALVNRAMLASLAGRHDEARDAARQAGQIAASTTDPKLRARHLADVGVATGAALAESDPAGAREALTRAIDFYTAHDLTFALPEPLLLRARVAARPADALADLERGMQVVERRRSGTPAAAGLLDAEHALFTDAIRLALERGDSASAFAFAERSRGSSITLAELQQRLSGTDAAVLEIVILGDELVTFAITERDVAVGRRKRSRNTAAGELLGEAGTTAAAALYDDVIAPVDSVLARATSLVIVPDARLESIPFAALFDARRKLHLIERFAVSIAANAGSLERETARGNALSLATIALPAGDASGSAGLPEIEREIGDVASLYPRAVSVPATFAAMQSAAADVIHIAGHTERLRGGGEQALLLADDERVSWKTIVTAPIVHRGLVVLAACETLRPPASTGTRALSLGGAFSAAGATDVVGTLAPIGDRDARLLFRELHRRLASGTRAADALRTVQRDAIERERRSGGRHAWRSLALLTRRLPAPPH
jgi:CHAT domain-containing protein